jgi:hypothetical protein
VAVAVAVGAGAGAEDVAVRGAARAGVDDRRAVARGCAIMKLRALVGAFVGLAGVGTGLEAQRVRPAAVPFAVGEQIEYRAAFGGIGAGKGVMRVESIDTVRGRPAYQVVFTIDGGIPGFRVRDRYASWVDVETLSSLMHMQQISQGRYRRTTSYEIWPERQEYQKNQEPIEKSVANPLDDGSFVYAVRALDLQLGETRRLDRYFRPDRNPVVLTVLRRDTVKVGPMVYPALVVRPTIRANGIFAEDGKAEIWFSDDDRRIPLQIKTSFAKISVTFTLTSYRAGGQ